MELKLPEPLSHAYVITGGTGESRRALARRLAAAYLCRGEHPPCGRCRDCMKVERGIHPDVFTLSPAEGKREISVGEARAMRSDVYIRPNEAEGKVYLIDPADALNSAAQNTLLKVLEDGPAYAAFLLLTEQPGLLLDTVRSRCETLALPPQEEQADPQLLEEGRALARVLLGGDEAAAVREAARLEGKKLNGERLAALLEAAQAEAARSLAQNRRAPAVLRALTEGLEAAGFNVGAGHILGWLCARINQTETGGDLP